MAVCCRIGLFFLLRLHYRSSGTDYGFKGKRGGKGKKKSESGVISHSPLLISGPDMNRKNPRKEGEGRAPYGAISSFIFSELRRKG